MTLHTNVTIWVLTRLSEQMRLNQKLQQCGWRVERATKSLLSPFPEGTEQLFPDVVCSGEGPKWIVGSPTFNKIAKWQQKSKLLAIMKVLHQRLPALHQATHAQQPIDIGHVIKWTCPSVGVCCACETTQGHPAAARLAGQLFSYSGRSDFQCWFGQRAEFALSFLRKTSPAHQAAEEQNIFIFIIIHIAWCTRCCMSMVHVHNKYMSYACGGVLQLPYNEEAPLTTASYTWLHHRSSNTGIGGSMIAYLLLLSLASACPQCGRVQMVPPTPWLLGSDVMFNIEDGGEETRPPFSCSKFPGLLVTELDRGVDVTVYEMVCKSTQFDSKRLHEILLEDELPEGTVRRNSSAALKQNASRGPNCATPA